MSQGPFGLALGFPRSISWGKMALESLFQQHRNSVSLSSFQYLELGLGVDEKEEGAPSCLTNRQSWLSPQRKYFLAFSVLSTGMPMEHLEWYCPSPVLCLLLSKWQWPWASQTISCDRLFRSRRGPITFHWDFGLWPRWSSRD